MMSLASQKEPLTQTTIRDLNRIVTMQTAPDKSEVGVYRAVSVWLNGLENHPYLDPMNIRPSIDRLIEWANANQEKLHPVVYAADFHLRFVAIRPFIDGNGRTARLLMNFALAQSGHQVSNVQPVRQERYTYMDRLEQARSGDEHAFDQLIVGYAEAELKRRIETLKLSEKSIRKAESETRFDEKN
ncbi:Fic family protein [Secundilactobacillus kimchicus JCM 15530]|uniref:Fic family protein n=1 Tax=Secundilactobacillus kimchicus JCM 15530 TaxID=1302272 RepID=A0A0R1HWD9_9LACO|nr:Fic family protein [Secundilactobacillus kimchicus]KRK48883.1 Fic family protein [Secundilactobacillus kimchicus JCM 15530]